MSPDQGVLQQQISSPAQAEVQGKPHLFKFGFPGTSVTDGWLPGASLVFVPWRGDVQATWKENGRRLRVLMGDGQPIYDSYRDPATGMQIPTRGFLNAERYLLESRNWRYNPLTGAYHPPQQ